MFSHLKTYVSKWNKLFHIVIINPMEMIYNEIGYMQTKRNKDIILSPTNSSFCRFDWSVKLLTSETLFVNNLTYLYLCACASVCICLYVYAKNCEWPRIFKCTCIVSLQRKQWRNSWGGQSAITNLSVQTVRVNYVLSAILTSFNVSVSALN